MTDIPDLLTIREVQAIFRRNYRATLRRVVRHLAPGGGVVRMGSRYLVHRWAVVQHLDALTVKPTAAERRIPIRTQTPRRPRRAAPRGPEAA